MFNYEKLEVDLTQEMSSQLQFEFIWFQAVAHLLSWFRVIHALWANVWAVIIYFYTPIHALLELRL